MTDEVSEKKQAPPVVDEQLGIAIGFACVSEIDGEPYYDLHGDHIPENVIAKAAIGFMENIQVSQAQHDGNVDGSIPFAMPITKELIEYLSKSKQTGLLIGMRPSEKTLKKMKNGDFTGFSIGGYIPSKGS